MSHSDQNTLEIFQAGDTRLEVRISPAGDTVWLTRHQLADLYGRDVKTIGKHIANALKEEMDTSTVAKFATVASNGKVYQIEHYNLDMVMSIGDIYQSFGGKDLYPSIEEKAANLLYFVTKNHAFSDGNKRIAAAVFIHFLKINGILQRDGRLVIANHTLVAIIVMIAESAPQEKETMTRLVMNFLVPEK